jgi:hydroxyacylglutathione hydrolase
MLDITTVPVTEFQQNARVVRCTETGELVIIDPGGDVDQIVDVVAKKKGRCVGIWLTHSHLDHCGGVAPLLKHYDVPLVAHPDEREMRAHVTDIAAMYGLAATDWPNCPEPTQEVYGGEVLKVGQHAASVLFTPGHSPGHVSFYFASDNVVLSGDTLFQGSIGRTDLPGGDHEQLLASIRRELLSLPDATKVLSGHGANTIIGIERRSNPFLGE